MNVPSKLPFAETVNYWKTGRSSSDSLIHDTVALLKKLGCKNIAEAFGSYQGRSAFLLSFEIGTERFQIKWPVLPTRSEKDEPAARRQAAAFVYHYAKARSLEVAILGSRAAFIGNLCLPDGSTVMENANPAIAQHVQPVALLGGSK